MIHTFWQNIFLFYKKYWWLTPLTIFLFWRLGLEAIGRITLFITTPVENLWPADPFLPLWTRWDSGWYSSIVTDGYNLREGLFSNTAFFPFYPLLWKLIWFITGWPRLISGVFVSNLAALATILIFYRWTEIKYDQNTAQKTIALWLAFPTSLFLIAAYSESVFVLLLVLILLMVQQKKWVQAAWLACLASATRPVGIILWLWLIYCGWREKDNAQKINPWLIFIPPLGLIFFSLYLWQVTGDPLAWLNQQSLFQRSWQTPLVLAADYLYLLFTGGKYWLIHAGEIASLIFSGWLTIRLFRRDLNQALLALGLLLPPLFTGILTSYPRFVLAALPVFLSLAQIKYRFIYFIYFAVSIPLLIMAVFNFVTWRWVA